MKENPSVPRAVPRNHFRTRGQILFIDRQLQLTVRIWANIYFRNKNQKS